MSKKKTIKDLKKYLEQSIANHDTDSKSFEHPRDIDYIAYHDGMYDAFIEVLEYIESFEVNHENQD